MAHTISGELASAISAAVVAVDLCGECVEREGLCLAHRSHVVPMLARASWLRLIGEALVEQTKRQSAPPDPVEARAIAKAKRHAARKLARRSAFFGLVR